MKKFGHYEVTAELGRGGMGVVYKGWDPSLNRKVAIKALGEHLLNDEDLKERFTREAKATAALNDANVIQIYFIGEEQGQPYFAMEFIEGESLDDILKGGKSVTIPHAKNLLKQASSGMAAAHKLDLVHRDIKPANMMLTTEGTLKIVDFGIARTREYGDKLTNTGEFVGTPGYLSPEVCIGQEVDLRSDIFSLGIVFYEMLAGKVPFENDSPLGLMLEVVQADIPDIRELNKKVDKKTSFVLNKMIAKSPDDRYQNCEEIIRDLGNVIDNQSLEEIKSKSLIAPSGPVKKSNISQQITLQGGQSITEPNLKIQPQQTNKSSKFGLIAASFFALVLAAGAFGYYGGYLPFSPNTQPTSPQLLTSSSQNDSQESEQLIMPAELAKEQTSQEKPFEPNEVVGAVNISDPVTSNQESQTNTQTKLQFESKSIPSEPSATLDEKEIVANAQSLDNTTEARLENTNLSSTVKSVNAELTSSLEQDVQQKVVQVVEKSISAKPSAHLSKIQNQVQKISQPKQVKLNKGVVVISLGDPAIANPVEKFIESQLKQEGIKVLNESFISGMSQALSQGVDMAEVRSLVMRNGGQALVIANVNHIGTQQLNYAGRSSTLVNAQLDIDSYDIKSGEMIGSGFGSTINYTSLNATEQATDAVLEYSEELKSILKQKI